MESERPLTPNSNVDSVRHDDAKPFSYRSALQALLGMSDVNGRQVRYVRIVPSVQLQYVSQPLTGQTSRLPEAVQETGLSFDDAAVHNPDSTASSPGVAALHHRPLREQPSRLPEAWQETGTSSFDNAAANNLDSAAGSQTATPHHGSPDEKAVTLLSVPPQPSPTGAAARYANPVAAHRASHLGALTQHTPRQRDTDATSEHDRGTGAATAKVEQPDEVLEEITIAVPGISEKPRHFPALAPVKQDDRLVSPAEEAEAVSRGRVHHLGTRSTQPPERGGLPAIGREPASASHLLAESQEMVLSRFGDTVGSSAGGDVTASIEQLRRTVRDLAAKMASRQTRTQDETQPQQIIQTPSQAAQRVVIIKPAAPRSGPSRAFWERSYLSRLSWRTLR